MGNDGWLLGHAALSVGDRSFRRLFHGPATVPNVPAIMCIGASSSLLAHCEDEQASGPMTSP